MRNTKTPLPVHFYKEVAVLVRQVGPCGRKDLAPYFPDATEAQIQRALDNAAYQDLIERLQSPSSRASQFCARNSPRRPDHEGKVPTVKEALKSRTALEVVWAGLVSSWVGMPNEFATHTPA